MPVATATTRTCAKNNLCTQTLSRVHTLSAAHPQNTLTQYTHTHARTHTHTHTHTHTNMHTTHTHTHTQCTPGRLFRWPTA